MGNRPSEYDGATCSQCGCSLPALRDWDDLKQEWIDGKETHVFFGGRYYRPVNGAHLCPDCFFRPRREREARERRERERREQQRRKEEAERKRREAEERRRKEQQKKEEAERKRREAEERRRKEQQKKEEAERKRREAEERRKKEQQKKEEAERRRREQNQLEGERESKALLSRYQNCKINRQISSNYQKESVVVKYYTSLQDDSNYTSHDILPIDTDLFYFLLYNRRKIVCQNGKFQLSKDEDSDPDLLMRFFPDTTTTNLGKVSLFNIQFITSEGMAWVGLDQNGTRLIPVSSRYESISVTVTAGSHEAVNIVCKSTAKSVNIGSDSALALVESSMSTSLHLKIASDDMCNRITQCLMEGDETEANSSYPDIVQSLIKMPYGAGIDQIPEDIKQFVECVSDLLGSSWRVCSPPQDYLDWLLSVLLDLYIRVEVKERKSIEGVSQILASVVSEIIDENFEHNKQISFLAAMCCLFSSGQSSRYSQSCNYKDREVFSDEDSETPIYPLKFLEDVMNASQGVESAWHSKCVKVYVRELFANNKETETFYKNFFANFFQAQLWPNEHIWSFAKMIKQDMSDDYDTLLQFLSIVLSNQRKDYEKVLEIYETFKGNEAVEEMRKLVKQDKDKDVHKVLQEIVNSGELSKDIYQRLRSIILSVIDLLSINFGYPLTKCGPIESCSDLRTKVKNMSLKQGEEVVLMSPADQDLSKTLVIMACSVNKFKGYWPRVTQMTSWTLLAISKDRGRLLEISTGEGKSCVVAMFAAMLANQGKHVDIVTSSSILADRDAADWRDFYHFFDVTVGSNINLNNDDERRSCYQNQIVFGTVASFAADILRQDFQQKLIRGERRYDAVIVDEVDFMLLDRGVQFTYLSQQVAGMRHLDPVLAMVWNLVSPFKAVELETGTTLFKGYPQPFYRAVLDFVDETTLTEAGFSGSVEDFLLLTLQKAEKRGLLKEGFTEEVMKVDPTDVKKLEIILQDVNEENVRNFLKFIGDLLDVHFIAYLSVDGITMKRADNVENSSHDFEIPIYVVGGGMCCNLLDDFEVLAKAIEENVLSRVSYGMEREESVILLPQNLEPLISNRLTSWIANAFEATRMKEGRHYLVQGGNILPIDFRSTGIVELNKKWGDGLQQFLEMKHHLNLSQMSLITNFMSNIAFFQKYRTNIFGVSGTLGSHTDKEFLQKLYNTEFCSIPTHRTKKLFEVEGMVVASKKAWCEEICQRLNYELHTKPGSGGRAALVICEDINSANDLSNEIKANVTANITLYTRSENEEARALDRRFGVGEVIVATNLAGRGTDVKLTDEVNANGGMFVLLTFLPLNERVERQAIGRTARKGKPGSAQMIILKDRLNPALLQGSLDLSLQTITLTRNSLEKIRMECMNQDVAEVLLKEKLFSQYCRFLSMVRAEITDEEEEGVIVEALNEKWGVWLKIKTESISKLRKEALAQELESDLQEAKGKCISKKSPSRNIYHIIKFGNELLFDGKYQSAKRQFTRAIDMNPNWSSIAYYNRAYCVIRLGKKEEDYLQKAIDDLTYCVKHLENYSTELNLVLFLLNSAKGSVRPVDETSSGYADHVEIRENILKFYRQNIQKAIAKLQEIKDQGRDAIAKPTAVFSLVPNADHDTRQELYEFWQIGLLQVFSVEKKPRFCWEGLLVAFIGALQIFAGACLTAVSCGTLTSIGTWLISEGVSDVRDGILATIQGGNFDWKAWGIGKAISIAASLVGAGVKKLIKTGVNMIRKISGTIGEFVDEAKTAMGVATSLKGSFDTVGKRIVQEFAEQTVMFGIESAEQAILSHIMGKFKERLSEMIKSSIANMVRDVRMGSYIERIVLHVVKDPGDVTTSAQSSIVNLLHDIFLTEVLQPYSSNSELTQYLYSALSSVRDELKDLGDDSKFGKIVFQSIDLAIDSAEVAKACVAIADLINTFSDKMLDSLSNYCRDQGIASREANVNAEKLQKVVGNIEKSLEGGITEEVTDFIVGMLEQTVSRTIIRRAKGCVNKHVNSHLKNFCGVQNTDERLRAEANSRQIAYLQHKTNMDDTSPVSKSHEFFPVKQYARQVEDPNKPGTLLDARVLSESLGVKITIMREGKGGKLVPKIETGVKTSQENISVLYRNPSEKFPEGHYDVIIDGKIVEVSSENKNCLFHAIAKSRNRNLSDEELEVISVRYRKETADEFQRNYMKWNKFLKRQSITMKLHGGYENLAIGAGKENVFPYILRTRSTISANTEVEHDHQPPYKCIRDAKNTSNLGKAMFEAAHGGKKTRDNLSGPARAPYGIAVRVPKQDHRAYLQTKYDEFRDLITNAINNENEVDVFKYTFVTSQTAQVINGAKKYTPDELSNRKEENREVVRQWADGVGKHNYSFDTNNINVINAWIDDGKFCDANDDHFKEVGKMLFARESRKAQTK